MKKLLRAIYEVVYFVVGLIVIIAATLFLLGNMIASFFGFGPPAD